MSLTRRRVLTGLAAACGVASWPSRGEAWDQWPEPNPPPIQGAATLNRTLMAVVRGYGFGTAHPYLWVPGTHEDGTTRDLSYRGVLVAKARDDGAVHCTGLTFEVWLQALEQVGAPEGLSAAGVLALKETWYVRDGERAGVAAGLARLGLGRRIDRIDELQPGDLVQFWRNSGKGHCAVVVDHRRRSDGSVRGLAVWSAQAASQGIGIRFATVGGGEHHVAELYGVRPTVPT